MAVHEIVMPKLGLTMTEGTIAEWLVRPGDAVRAGMPLFVVETEKIANEIEASADGRIEALHADVGDVVPVGAVVATWSLGDTAQPPPKKAEHRPESPRQGSPRPEPERPEPAPVAAPNQGARINGAARVIATPLARRLANERGIDLTGIVGTGPRGRIKAKDVETENLRPKSPPVPIPTKGSRRPATNVQKIVARRLTEAKQTIPHFYVTADIDIRAAASLREQLNGEPGHGKVTLTHIIVAAVGRALAVMPEFDAVWDADDIVTLGRTDVGLAVDTPRGLMVPVVRAAGRLPLDGVAASAADLVARARAGRLAEADLQGGAVSVSNVGMFGAASLIPIINPGQSAILGVGAPKDVFRPDRAGAPELRQELTLTLSCDHRLLDGVKGARFLQCVATFLEAPARLLRTPQTSI